MMEYAASQYHLTEDRRMDQQPKRTFNWRGFVSVTAGLAFLGLTISGIALFFLPPGRIANWNDWRMLGLRKQQWIGLHIWFGVLFFILALVHVYYNWKPLLSYFRDETRRRLALRWEWAAALLLIWVMSVGTIRGMMPFSSFLNWHATIKHRHDNRPAGTESGLIQESGRGYRGGRGAATDATVQPVTSPETVSHRSDRGRGFGQMTLSDYCTQMEIDLTEACAILEQAGMTADANRTLREIASTGQVHPSEIRRLLLP
jgi:hypothetical protein